jgi:nucleotide-binding universal stress UspA family protein
MERIVVGVDGSASSARALRWAAREAALHRLPLVAVAAWLPPEEPQGWLGEGAVTFSDEIDALTALDRRVDQALGVAGADRVERRVVRDRPGPGLVVASTGASLLVVGVRRFGALRSELLGSVSRHCLHHASCPLAIVREPGWQTDGAEVERIVVGVDGSPTARRALRWAICEAGARGAALEVVHAWQRPYFGLDLGPVLPDEATQMADARRILDEAVDQEDTGGVAQGVERSLVAGEAASALLERAGGADLVVVGSRGAGGFRDLLVGSVGQQVARRAPCSVVAVPPDRTGDAARPAPW